MQASEFSLGLIRVGSSDSGLVRSPRLGNRMPFSDSLVLVYISGEFNQAVSLYTCRPDGIGLHKLHDDVYYKSIISLSNEENLRFLPQ